MTEKTDKSSGWKKMLPIRDVPTISAAEDLLY